MALGAPQRPGDVLRVAVLRPAFRSLGMAIGLILKLSLKTFITSLLSGVRPPTGIDAGACAVCGGAASPLSSRPAGT